MHCTVFTRIVYDRCDHYFIFVWNRQRRPTPRFQLTLFCCCFFEFYFVVGVWCRLEKRLSGLLQLDRISSYYNQLLSQFVEQKIKKKNSNILYTEIIYKFESEKMTKNNKQHTRATRKEWSECVNTAKRKNKTLINIYKKYMATNSRSFDRNS